MSRCPFPAMITITPQAPLQNKRHLYNTTGTSTHTHTHTHTHIYIYIYIYIYREREREKERGRSWWVNFWSIKLIIPRMPLFATSLVYFTASKNYCVWGKHYYNRFNPRKILKSHPVLFGIYPKILNTKILQCLGLNLLPTLNSYW